jgi:hypothetical protein
MKNLEILKKVILKEVLLTDDFFITNSFSPEYIAEKRYFVNDESQKPVIATKVIHIPSIGKSSNDNVAKLKEMLETLESFSTKDFLSMYREECEKNDLTINFVKENYVDVWEEILNSLEAKIEELQNARNEFYNERYKKTIN